jgi:hypothetical protein
VQGEAQAIMRCAPAPVGSASAPNRNFDITPSATGGVASQWVVPGTGAGLPGCWITLTNYSTANINFCAGDANTIADAAATDSVLIPGASQDYWLNVGIDRLRFRGAAIPAVSAHRSSL